MATPIHIITLAKHFGLGRSRTVAVHDVTIHVEPGELFFLLGPSGCGKTTLLRMIAGFIAPTRGRVKFGDSDVTHTPANKRDTGMVFQSYALWPHMTVEGNVAFGLNVRKVKGAERTDRVREALATVHMTEYAKRKPNELSGGQQQRVALARALVVRPRVLLLDEPLSNLDAKLRLELRAEIRRICKEAGLTTVYVTHDQKEALSMADRIAVMQAGRVVQVGPPRELYRRPRTRFVAEFLGEANFIPGTVIERKADRFTVRTAVGELVAAVDPAAAPTADEVLCAIRPEALRMSLEPGSNNTLKGTVVETTYLGEMAQHVVELPDGTRVKAADINPRASDAAGTRVEMRVDEGDVMVIAP